MSIGNDESFETLESTLVLVSPFKGRFSCERSKRGKKMCTFRPHITVKIHSSNERAKVGNGLRSVKLENSVDLFLPRLDSIRCKPVTEPICFLDGPFALERVDGKSIFLKARQCLVEVLEVFFPEVGEDSDVVNESFDALNKEISESFFECTLSPIGL